MGFEEDTLVGPIVRDHRCVLVSLLRCLGTVWGGRLGSVSSLRLSVFLVFSSLDTKKTKLHPLTRFFVPFRWTLTPPEGRPTPILP